MQAPQAPVSNSGDDPSQSPSSNTVLSYCAKKSVAVASGLGAYFTGLGVFLVHRTARAAAQTLGAKGEAIDGSSAWLQGERNKFSKLNEKIDAYSAEAGVKKIDSEYIEQYLKRHSSDLNDTEKLRDAELQILLKQKLIED